MTTQPEGTAATPAADTASANDGIIDFDALSAAETPDNDIEDGEIKTDAETEAKETPEAAAKAEEEAEARKKLSGAQRAKIREQRLMDEIAARDRELETLKAKGRDAGNAGDAPKPPKEEDFNGDYFAYTKAAAAFEAAEAARKIVSEQLKSREDADRAQTQQRAAQQRRLDHAERVETAREVITDFDEAMEGMKGVNVRDDLIEEIMASESSAVITYHLAKNPDKLEQLNRLPPRELAREMGRLEATLKLPEPKTKTSAPPPLSTRKGGASPPKGQEQVLSSWLDKTYGKDRR
jgi:hypothetical protein